MKPVFISSWPRSKSDLANSSALCRDVISASAARKRVVRLLHVGLGGAQLRLVFRRGELRDNLPLRDARAFLHGHFREAPGVFRGDVDLGRFKAAVRLDDAVRQRLAAEAGDQIPDGALCMRRGNPRDAARPRPASPRARTPRRPTEGPMSQRADESSSWVSSARHPYLVLSAAGPEDLGAEPCSIRNSTRWQTWRLRAILSRFEPSVLNMHTRA